MNTTLAIKEHLIAEIDNLTVENQQLVLDFARSLHSTLTQGIPGKDMVAKNYDFLPLDLKEIEQAIFEDCENIDRHEW